MACIKTSTVNLFQGAGNQEVAYVENAGHVIWLNPIDESKSLSGSSFAIHKEYLMTAGHVCKHAQERAGTEDIELGVFKYDEKGAIADLTVATVAYIDEVYDVCVLYAPYHTFMILPISQSYDTLRVGMHTSVIGFPKAKLEVSDQHITLVEEERLMLNGMAYGGHSGSAVIYNGEIIGLLYAFQNDRRYVIMCVPAPVLQDILNDLTKE